MRLQLRALSYRVNQQLLKLGARDSWLVGVIAVALVVGLQMGVAHLAGWTGGPDVSSQLATERRQVQALEEQLAILGQQQENPRAQELTQQINRLNADLERINQAVSRVTDSLISPDQMVRVLRDLLAQQDGLALKRLQTLPVTTAAGAAPDAAQGTQVYRHAITLELEGSFNAVARYLRSIEQSAYRVYWSDMTYTVNDHPTGRLSLTLYTLSAQEGWLNV